MQSKNVLSLMHVFLTGGDVCDGRKANLHEASARQPLHAGPGLFPDLLVGAVRLHSL